MQSSEEQTQGWIAVHRKLLAHPRYKDPEWVTVWLYLLLHATHKSMRVLFNGKEVILLPGQLITGRFVIGERTGVHPSKVNRLLAILKSDHQIDQQAGNKSSLITITNWSQYQHGGQQNDQQPVHNRPENGQQPTTNNNENTDNNANIQSSIAEKLLVRKREEDLPELTGGNRELLNRLLTRFTPLERENDGGKWSVLVRTETSDFERLVSWIDEDVKNGKLIRTFAGLAQAYWKVLKPK